MFRIDAAVFLYGALLILVLPMSWLLAAAAAALIHELCHMCATRLLGGKISGIRIEMGGIRIDAYLPHRWQEILAAAAGPAGSLLLLLLIRWIPKIAICGAAQGLYNFLPIYPLDGGRILRHLMEILYPERSEKATTVLETMAAMLLFAAAMAVASVCSPGIWPILAVLFPISRLLCEKLLAKRGKCEYNSATTK